MARWKEFEELVAQIEKLCVEHANTTVEHNVRLKCKDGTKRQIDILITQKNERFDYLTIIECKDHKSRVNVNTVGAFSNLLQTLNASKGIIVSVKGFQEGAVTKANNAGILLYTFSQVQNLKDRLSSELMFQYEIKQVFKHINVHFKEETEINSLITLYSPLIIPASGGITTIVEVMEYFVYDKRPLIANKLAAMAASQKLSGISNFPLEIKIEFPNSVIFKHNNISSVVDGFGALISTDLIFKPTEILDIREYKDSKSGKTFAAVYEVIFEGKKINIIEKNNQSELGEEQN